MAREGSLGADRQKRKTTTVTLAAHVRQGLITISILSWLKLMSYPIVIMQSRGGLQETGGQYRYA